MLRKKFFSAKNIAYLAVLLALVVVLQSIALVTGIFMPTSLSFVLIPIVIGAALMGPIAGAILGFMFGVMTVIFGVTGADSFTFLLFSEHPFLTLLTCFLKAIAAGVVPAFVFRLLKGKNRYVAVIVAAACAPILNTTIFVLGAMTMWQTFESLSAGAGVIYFIIVTCALTNFLIELGTTVVAAPAIYRVMEIVQGRRTSAPAPEHGEESGEISTEAEQNNGENS